jgi:hypothetical protein
MGRDATHKFIRSAYFFVVEERLQPISARHREPIMLGTHKEGGYPDFDMESTPRAGFSPPFEISWN